MMIANLRVVLSLCALIVIVRTQFIRNISSTNLTKPQYEYIGNQSKWLATSYRDDCPNKKDSIDEFPEDLFTETQRLNGAILVHLVVGFYCFVLIAFVCNDFFLPSVYYICQDLHLSQDIAGATFMATATCAPELFVNIIGTFLTESDLGVGTVVGSAVCNILGVTGCAGLAASKSIKLEVWPLLRDSAIYILSVGLLALILADNMITWYEALSLIVLYFVYFILMFTQKKIKKAMNKALTPKNSFYSTSSRQAIFASEDEYCCYGTYRPFYFTDFTPISEKTTTHNNVNTISQNITKNNELDEEVAPICNPPGSTMSNVWWCIALPVSALLYISIPDCRVRKKYYPITFIMCIVWIGISSYIVSWMMTIFGYTFHVNDAVMGMTFLAIGGSIPEAASGIANARRGIGSMSISNALGANTLDILLCLSGPWLIKTLMPISMNGGPIQIETKGLTFNCICLIISIVVLNVVTYSTSFQMNRLFGLICLIIYFSFITIFVLVDMNILFSFNTNLCH